MTDETNETAERQSAPNAGWKRKKFFEELLWGGNGTVDDAVRATKINPETVVAWAADPSFSRDLERVLAARVALEGATNFRQLLIVRDDPASTPEARMDALKMLERIARPEAPLPEWMGAVSGKLNAFPAGRDKPRTVETDQHVGDVAVLFHGLPPEGEARSPIVNMPMRARQRAERRMNNSIQFRLSVERAIMGFERMEVGVYGCPEPSMTHDILIKAWELGANAFALPRPLIEWSKDIDDDHTYIQLRIQTTGKPAGGSIKVTI